VKVTSTYWFSPGTGDLVGIVIGLDEETGKPKAYIGSIPFSRTEEYDALMIAENGTKLALQTLLEIVAKLKA